jgi:hypothetical protein
LADALRKSHIGSAASTSHSFGSFGSELSRWRGRARLSTLPLWRGHTWAKSRWLNSARLAWKEKVDDDAP